jgi:peptide/nickel transport system permease protein
LGLNGPLPTQYAAYLYDLAHLNMGRSLHSHAPVTASLEAAFPATLRLTLAALLLAVIWSIPLGVWSAVHQHSLLDAAANAAALLGMSLPAVFLGPILIYVFAIRLGWFPVSEDTGMTSLVLPALSLALPVGSSLLRITRMAMLESINQDYIRTAQAKGLSNRAVHFKHALRNALVPVVTIAGLQLGALLTGTVVTETIFDWPGIGSLLFGSIQRRDFPVVQGCVLLVAGIYVVVNLMTDLAYGWVNPKIRQSGES